MLLFRSIAKITAFGAAGGAIGSAIREDYEFSMWMVICCAVNHYVYNQYTKRLKQQK